MPRLKPFKVTVYRPRLERRTVTVYAENAFSTTDKAISRAERLRGSWELLPSNTSFPGSGYQEDPFIMDESDQPRIPS